MTPLPTRLMAGAEIPDTPIVRRAIALAHRSNSEAIFNHVMRSMIFGFLVADKVPQLRERDKEVHAVAAVLHDMGLPLGDSSEYHCLSHDKRFEVDGANAARRFLTAEASAETWDCHRVQLVWDAIALHATGSIALHKEPEVQACAIGIRTDFFGPDRTPGGLLSWQDYDTCVKEYPRLHLIDVFKANMLSLCMSKPRATYDNTVGEWGDRYLDKDVYDRANNLTQAHLERSGRELDERQFSTL